MAYKYRLYHEVEVSTRFTHRGPQVRGCVNCGPRCVNHVETNTEPTCTMGCVALITRPRPSNYSVGHKRLEHVPSNSANHPSRVLSIESDARHRWPQSDAIFCPTLASSLTFITTVLLSLCRKGRPHSRCVEFNLKKSATAAVLSTAGLGFTRSTHKLRGKTCPLIISVVLCIAPLHYSYLLCSFHCWLHAVTK